MFIPFHFRRTMFVLQNFINEYEGKTGIGDTDQNKGQCVGLVEVYLDQLNLNTPHLWGNAVDLFANADPNKFKKVPNNPNDLTQFPPVGAIIIWNQNFGNGFGHCGIVTKADGSTFTVFEQNDLTPDNPNGACQIKDWSNYDNVIGWIIPDAEIILDDNTDLTKYRLPSGNVLDLANVETNKITAIMWDAVVNLHQYTKNS